MPRKAFRFYGPLRGKRLNYYGALSSNSGSLRKAQAPIASEFISHLKALSKAHPKKTVIWYGRVSTDLQRPNLREARRFETERLRKLGWRVIATSCECANGSIWEERPWLHRAIALARKHGAILVANSRDRLLRADGFWRSNSSDTLSSADYDELGRISNGVTIATITHPDKSGRPSQIKRGQKEKKRAGGRPLARTKRLITTERRLEIRRFVRACRKSEWTFQKIQNFLRLMSRFKAHGHKAAKFKVPVLSTLSNWTKSKKA